MNPVPQNWESELGKGLRSAEDLCRHGLLRTEEVPAYRPLLLKYKFFLPRYYAELIDPSDPDCPIRRQAIPDLRELERQSGMRSDPLADLDHQPAPRLTHRYANRALLHLTPNCSMYCRYCFRKTLLNELSPDLFQGALREAYAYLQAHTEIDEVILSGGDPLLLADRQLEGALAELSSIPHLQRLRVHTRVPVTFPVRVTSDLARALRTARLPVVLVCHFNHPKEITQASSAACESFRKEGIILLNQSVLLRGVNDSAQVLAELSRRLLTIGVIPYYLHHPDRARGTQHFDLPMERGLEIFAELRRALPGYLVPRYVVDLVGAPHKQEVSEVVRGTAYPPPHFFFQPPPTPSISID